MYEIYEPAFRVAANHKDSVSHEAIATWIQAGRLQAKADRYSACLIRKRLQMNYSQK